MHVLILLGFQRSIAASEPTLWVQTNTQVLLTMPSSSNIGTISATRATHGNMPSCCTSPGFSVGTERLIRASRRSHHFQDWSWIVSGAAEQSLRCRNNSCSPCCWQVQNVWTHMDKSLSKYFAKNGIENVGIPCFEKLWGFYDRSGPGEIKRSIPLAFGGDPLLAIGTLTFLNSCSVEPLSNHRLQRRSASWTQW